MRLAKIDLGFRGRPFVLLAAMALLWLAACARKEMPAPFVAKVGDRIITAEDLKREAERQAKLHRSNQKPEALLSEMVQFEAEVQRARKAGLADDPQIQREIGLMLISKLKERELGARLEAVQVTADEIKAEYDRDIDKFTQKAKVRLSLLFLPVEPKASESKKAETRERLLEARRRTLENPPRGGRGPAASGFGALAIEFSDEQTSRYRGGDIGWLDAGKFEYRWPRSVLEAAYQLPKNEMTAVLEANDGFYLVMKTDERPGSITPFAQAETGIRHSLLLKKKRALEEEFRKEALQLAGVQINEKELASVQLKPAATEIARNSEPPALPLGVESANKN